MKRRLNNSGYTLLEVMVAAVLIGASMSAAVSLSATMKTQEELSWRVTVATNYQENVARLWQFGQTDTDIIGEMPSSKGNAMLEDALEADLTPPISTDPKLFTSTPLGSSSKDGFATLEGTENSVQVGNFGSLSGTGATTTVGVYRPTVRGQASP